MGIEGVNESTFQEIEIDEVARYKAAYLDKFSIAFLETIL